MKLDQSLRSLLSGLPDRHVWMAILPSVVRTGWPLLALAALVLAVILVDLILGSPTTGLVRRLWADRIDPLVSIATLGVAVSVWLVQTYRNWERELPKRLTVRFVLDGQEVMCCNRAYMTDATGIRELAQTIGRQMADPQHVKEMVPFCAPAIRLLADETRHEGEGESIEHYRHYTVEFELTKRPVTVKEGMRVVWDPPFRPENLLNVYPDGRREVRDAGSMAP